MCLYCAKRETLPARDMYADLEKIEARGKRKKEKSKGLFSSFNKKDEPGPDEKNVQQPQPEPAPATEPVVSAPPKPAPVKREPIPEPPKAAPAPAARQQPAPKPGMTEEQGWKPLSGGKLKKAEEDLLAYKRWLNHGYKTGVLTKEQCIDMVIKKEMELGLKPPK